MSSSKALFSLSVLVLFGMSSAAPRVVAQQPAPERTPAPAAQSGNGAQQSGSDRASAQTNDLEITANVTARELRFEVVPDPKVEFPGQPKRETVWDAERQNLPRPVEPGVTYRDIGIRLIISSRFADIDRIVAEALGEVPVTDDAAPEKAAPPAQPSPSTTPERKP